MTKSLIIIISILASCVGFALAISDEFHEELFLKPLEDGRLYAYFQFTLLWRGFNGTERDFNHCHLFPHRMVSMISKFDVSDLYVTLTEGLWRYEKWGYPVVDAAPGAEIRAAFSESARDIDASWKRMGNSFSGLLCASTFVDAVNSAAPYTDEWTGKWSGNRVRYATLPREIACTENLTPWKKLLPCGSSRGLAALLNARYIHNTNYHSIGVRMFRGNEGLVLKQTVSLVYDLAIVNGVNDDVHSWSLRKLFGQPLQSFCPLAGSSNIYLDVTSDGVKPVGNPHEIHEVRRTYKYARWDVSNISRLGSEDVFNLAVVSTATHRQSPRKPMVYANRFVSGYGHQRAGIVTKIRNNHRLPIPVIYMENIPWFVPLYLHTLKITAKSDERWLPQTLEPKRITYTPGKARSRPYYLEVELDLPPRSSVELSFEFDYVFLKWQEYPPDANHGFYVGSATLLAVIPYPRNYTAPPDGAIRFSDTWKKDWVVGKGAFLFKIRLRTESFIVTLPTPDFSMPYNVICLTCTVVALAFGPLHNITTKKLRMKTNKTWLASVWNKVTTWLKEKRGISK